MQAIILAAGMGRRLGEYTQNSTKCMVEVNGVKLIDRMLNQLLRLHLNKVIIVVGYKGDTLMTYLQEHYPAAPLEFVNNPIYDKTNNIYSLSLVKDRMEEDDTLLLESDLIFEEVMLQKIVEHPYPNLALVAKYKSWMDGTVVKLDEDNNIVNFITRQAFKYEEVDQYYKTVNIYKFSKEFSTHKYVPFLEAYCKALGNNEYYEQVLRVITFLSNSDIKALPIGDENWYEIDDVQDLNTASTLFKDTPSRLTDLSRRFGGYWRFPGIKDYCLLVNPYFPPQRMIEEMKNNFEILLRDYPSGMGINSLLAGKYFGIKSEYVTIGNGAAELIKCLMEQMQGKTGIVYPTFEEYPNRLPSASIVPFLPTKEDFSYSIDDIKHHCTAHQLSAMLLVNPDNPTGHMLPVTDILGFCSWAERQKIQVIVDESFVDFSDHWETSSLLQNQILEQHPNLIVIKSISKSYGVPGLRLGIMASSSEDLIRKSRKSVAIWNINSMAEFYMQIFNKYEYLYKDACRKFVIERKRFEAQLKTIPFLKVYPSQANYFLCKVLAPWTTSALTCKLLENANILIKDCHSKHGLENTEHIRIAIHGTEENNLLIDTLRKLQ